MNRPYFDVVAQTGLLNGLLGLPIAITSTQ
jgi:hypothetical protein